MVARTACLFAVVLLFATNSLSDTGTKANDLQGAWKLASLTAEAGPIGLSTPPPELVIKGDRVIYGGEEIARIVTDAKTDPKLFDLRFANPEHVYEGVYTVEKDTLKICLNGRMDGVKERPQSFSLEDHPGYRLLTFERIKGGNAGAGNGFVGLALRIDRERGEVSVSETLEKSPAKKAGLRKDDVVLQVGEVRVTDLLSAVNAVRQAKPGSELTLQIRRDGKESEVKVKVGLFPFQTLIGLE